MIRYYGGRYLNVDEFIRHCKNLNIKVDKKELEYYEKGGIMLPLIRVAYPEDYIRLLTLWSHGKISNSPDMNQWPGLAEAFDKRRVLSQDYSNMTDDELIDSFDRGVANNPFLSRPSANNYKPWQEYEIEIEYEEGQRINKKIS